MQNQQQTISDLLTNAGYSLEDLANPERQPLAIAALDESIASLNELLKTNKTDDGPFKLDFWNKPIPIAFTLQHYDEEPDAINITEHRIVVRLRRASAEESDFSQFGGMLTGDKQKESPDAQAARLASLLYDEPTGLEGWPTDDRPLADRALEYFNAARPGIEPTISTILFYYRGAVGPLRLFR